MIHAIAGLKHHRPPDAGVEPELALRFIGGWRAAWRATEAKISIADIGVGGQRGRRRNLAKPSHDQHYRCENTKKATHRSLLTVMLRHAMQFGLSYANCRPV